MSKWDEVDMAVEVDLGNAFRRVYSLRDAAEASLVADGETAESIEIRFLCLRLPSAEEFQGVFALHTSEGQVLERHASGADGIQALIATLEIIAIHLMRICSDRGRMPVWNGQRGAGLVGATRGVQPIDLVRDLPEAQRLNLAPLAKLSPYCRREFDVETPGKTTAETGYLELLETGNVRVGIAGIDPAHYCLFRIQWPGQSEDEYVVYGADGFAALCDTFDAIERIAHQLSERHRATVKQYGMPGLDLRVRDLWNLHANSGARRDNLT